MWGKTRSKIYGPRTGEDYKDNQLRFSLLCLVSYHIVILVNRKKKKKFVVFVSLSYKYETSDLTDSDLNLI